MKPRTSLRSPNQNTQSSASTLLELLSAMAILSVIILVLGLMLESALGHFRRGTDSTALQCRVRDVTEWMERDLATHDSSRVLDMPRLPSTVPAIQREIFEDKLIFPFEVNRVNGTGSITKRSFANAAPGFDSLAFVTRLGSPFAKSGDSAPAIVGYYVAYARHSPLAGESGAGMKLFRHCRRGGHATAEGYADGILRRVSLEINGEADLIRTLGATPKGALPSGHFENTHLPFLLSRRIDPGDDSSPRLIVQPWPSHPLRAHLTSTELSASTRQSRRLVGSGESGPSLGVSRRGDLRSRRALRVAAPPPRHPRGRIQSIHGRSGIEPAPWTRRRRRMARPDRARLHRSDPRDGVRSGSRTTPESR